MSEEVKYVKIDDYSFEVAKAEVYEGRENMKHQVLVRTQLSQFNGMKKEWVEVTEETRWFEGTEEYGGFDKSHPRWNAVWLSHDHLPQYVPQWLWENKHRNVPDVDYSAYKNTPEI